MIDPSHTRHHPADHARTVVVLRALGLGDLCTGLPAVRAIRRAYPTHRLVVAAPAWQAPLLRHAVAVDEIADVSALSPLPLRLTGVAVAVNLHGSGPQSTRLLIERRPDRLVAFEHDSVSATHGSPAWRAHEHDVHRWCRLLSESGVAADPSDLALPGPAVPPPVAPGTVIVHPGAASPARRWPADRFASVVRALDRGGHSVAITGSRDELDRCESIAAAAGGAATVLAGRTSLVDLDAAVAVASAVLSNDTGVAHLATAHGTPSVVLFGPSPPSEWGPPPAGPHRVLWKGGRGDPHAEAVDPCLLMIDVDEVLNALADVVATRV